MQEFSNDSFIALFPSPRYALAMLWSLLLRMIYSVSSGRVDGRVFLTSGQQRSKQLPKQGLPKWDVASLKSLRSDNALSGSYRHETVIKLQSAAWSTHMHPRAYPHPDGSALVWAVPVLHAMNWCPCSDNAFPCCCSACLSCSDMDAGSQQKQTTFPFLLAWNWSLDLSRSVITPFDVLPIDKDIPRLH